VLLKEGNEYKGKSLKYTYKKKVICYKTLMLATNENIEI
jgi:hypothetical protein